MESDIQSVQIVLPIEDLTLGAVIHIPAFVEKEHIKEGVKKLAKEKGLLELI